MLRLHFYGLDNSHEEAKVESAVPMSYTQERIQPSPNVPNRLSDGTEEGSVSRIVNRFKNGLSRLTYGGDIAEGNSNPIKANVPSRLPPNPPKPSAPPAKVLPKPASAVGSKSKHDLVVAVLVVPLFEIHFNILIHADSYLRLL